MRLSDRGWGKDKKKRGRPGAKCGSEGALLASGKDFGLVFQSENPVKIGPGVSDDIAGVEFACLHVDGVG